LNSGDSILVKIGTHDYLTTLLDDENISGEYEATAATIDNIAQFAADLRPPKIVDALPVLPDNNYPLDSSVVYDGKLYINENGSWVSKVKEAETAVNALVAGTVEAGAIGVDELASAEAIIQKLGANELIVDGHAQIRKATIDDSHLINVSATKIISDEMIADLMVSRGSITIKGNETEDVDSLAMMGMGPQKDKEIQNEWDAWEMSQDAIQGFDNNGNKQAELTNEGKIKLTDDEGNYALLDSDLLAFYEAGSDTPHWYSKRVAYGTAQDGDYVELNWDKAPKIMTSIKSLTSYNENYDGDTQQYSSYASSISKDGFYVHGRSIIPSGTEVLDNNYSNSVTWNGTDNGPLTFSGTYTSDWSNQSTVSNILADITFRVEPEPSNGYTVMDANWSLTIKYETDGGTVYTHDSVSGYESWNHEGNITETLYSSAINIATSDDKYRLIVEWSLTGDNLISFSSYSPQGKPSIYINNQETKAEIIVDNGEVSWIAIEGGAE
jgi:VCBS repeat-containing protein